MWGWGHRGNNAACLALAGFQYFPCYLQANWALLVQILGWVILCMFLDPVGLSNKLSCEAGSFSHPRSYHSPHRFLQPEVLRLYFPALEPWVVWSVSFPSCSGLSTHRCEAASYRLAKCPLGPSCPCLPLLPVWMSVSSLIPWLLHFHTVKFSSSSGYFFVSVVVLRLVVRGGKMYLCMPPSWPEVLGVFSKIYNM